MGSTGMVVGGVAGGAIGSAGGPPGTLIGAGAGSFIGSTAEDAIFGGPKVAAGPAPEPVDPYAFQWGANLSPQAIADMQEARRRRADAGLRVDYLGDRQLAHVSNLEDAAQGRVPSVAEELMRRGGAQARAGAASQAASTRGANYALASRAASNALAQADASVASSSAELRAKEMAEARGELSRALGGFRGQDIGREEFFDRANADITKSSMQGAQAFWDLRGQNERAYLNAVTQANAAAAEAAAKEKAGLFAAAGQIGAAGIK